MTSKFFGLIPAVFLLVFALPITARAKSDPKPGRYSGVFSDSGIISFKVLPSGRTISRVRFTDVVTFVDGRGYSSDPFLAFAKSQKARIMLRRRGNFKILDFFDGGIFSMNARMRGKRKYEMVVEMTFFQDIPIYNPVLENYDLTIFGPSVGPLRTKAKRVRR